MEPELMDVVELVQEIAVEPEWHIGDQPGPALLPQGTRGMIVHREDGTSQYRVEIEVGTTRLLAKLDANQFRVVERYTIEEE